MDRREKIKKVVEILKKSGRLQKNELIRRIVDDGSMSHQTASDAIDDTVSANKIIRDPSLRGKQKIVWLSVSGDISKQEKEGLKILQRTLNDYDNRFAIIQEKFPSLSIIQKADGVDLLTHILIEFGALVKKLSIIFGDTSEWTKFESEIKARELDIDAKLKPMCSEKEQAKIYVELMAITSLDVTDSFDDIDDYLKGINK